LWGDGESSATKLDDRQKQRTLLLFVDSASVSSAEEIVSSSVPSTPQA